MRRFGWTTMLCATLVTAALTGCGRSSVHIGVGTGYLGGLAPCPSYGYGVGYGGGYGYSTTSVHYRHYAGSRSRGHFGHRHGSRRSFGHCY